MTIEVVDGAVHGAALIAWSKRTPPAASSSIVFVFTYLRAVAAEVVRPQCVGHVDDDVHSAADCSDDPLSAGPYDRGRVTDSRDVDSAIDRLDEALRAAGLTAVEPPSDVARIAELDEAVAPYAIPGELRRFWERVDAERVPVFTFPMIRGPGAALELLRGLRELGQTVPLVPPPLLLPLDYASHCHGVIELASEWSEGGTILEWGYDDFPLVARSVGDRIDVLAELLFEGRFERGDGFISLDHQAEQEKRRARLAASGPDRIYGDLRAIPIALESWPAHWLAASGVDLRDRMPRGATHTIAEIVAAANVGRVTGRIHGEVIRLVGIGANTLVVVDDGTRPLDVWCPAGTSPWGPVHRTSFEFEVTLEGRVGAPPDLDSGHEEIVGTHSPATWQPRRQPRARSSTGSTSIEPRPSRRTSGRSTRSDA